MTIQLNNRSGGPAHACEAMHTEHARARAWPHQRPPARGRQPRRPPGGKKNPASMHASEWGVEPPTLAHRARRFPLQAADQGQKLRRPDNREHHLVSTLAIRSGTRSTADRQKSEVGEAKTAQKAGRPHTHTKQQKAGDRGPKRRKTGHSPPAGGASMGPSALDRKPSAVCSSVRSHGIVGSQRGAPRRHRCRPPACCEGFWHALRGQVGRIPSPGVAGERIWPVREAPDRNIRARQKPRGTARSRASAPCPRAAVFFATTLDEEARPARSRYPPQRARTPPMHRMARRRRSVR